jgi:hypothetical protein
VEPARKTIASRACTNYKEWEGHPVGHTFLGDSHRKRIEMSVTGVGESFWSRGGVKRDSRCIRHRGFRAASTSLSPFPLENTGLPIVPPMRKGNCNFPSTNAAPERRATALVKKLSLVVISAKPR